MKRLFISLVSLCVCALMMAQGVTYESGKFIYKLSGNNAILVAAADENVTDVRIPSTVKINGVKYPVTGIADGAFYNQENLLSVSIGVNIQNIGDGAFFGCPKLKAVYSYALTPPKCSGKMAVFGFEDGAGSVLLPADMVVYVSAGSVADYRASAVWSETAVEPMVTKF